MSERVLFVVMGTGGGYEPASWPVRAFADRTAALEFAGMATRHLAMLRYDDDFFNRVVVDREGTDEEIARFGEYDPCMIEREPRVAFSVCFDATAFYYVSTIPLDGSAS